MRHTTTVAVFHHRTQAVRSRTQHSNDVSFLEHMRCFPALQFLYRRVAFPHLADLHGDYLGDRPKYTSRPFRRHNSSVSDVCYSRNLGVVPASPLVSKKSKQGIAFKHRTDAGCETPVNPK